MHAECWAGEASEIKSQLQGVDPLLSLVFFHPTQSPTYLPICLSPHSLRKPTLIYISHHAPAKPPRYDACVDFLRRCRFEHAAIQARCAYIPPFATQCLTDPSLARSGLPPLPQKHAGMRMKRQAPAPSGSSVPNFRVRGLRVEMPEGCVRLHLHTTLPFADPFLMLQEPNGRDAIQCHPQRGLLCLRTRSHE
jgi:hypothetical protein